MQHGWVIAYASCQLRAHEHKYPMHDLELVTVVFSLMIQRQYLYGMHCDLYIDHRSLKYIITQQDLNFCQRRWMELRAECDLPILYHLDKANVVVYALSQKSMSMDSLAHLSTEEQPLDLDIQSLANRFIRLDISDSNRVLYYIRAQSSLVDLIWARQFRDEALVGLKDRAIQGVGGQTTIYLDGILRFDGWLCVPRVGDLIQLIICGAHDSMYFIHSGMVKMYRD